ncbi:MAG: hypothetical protein V4605_04900, partial [Pseudomonadota bacterium]
MSLSLLFFRGNTQLFLRNTTANGLSRGGTALFDLLTTQGNSPDTAVVNTTIAGTEIQFTKTAGGTPVAFITPRFGAAYTITGIDIANWFLESMVLVNVGARYRFYRYRAGVETEFIGSPSDDGVEFTTIAELYTWAAGITALDFLEDDRLLIVPYVVNVGVMAAGTATLNFNCVSPAATRLVQKKSAGSVTATAVTVTLNAAPTVGNLLVAVHFTRGTTATRPTGFAQDLLVNNATNADQLQICSKIVQAGDGTAYTFGATPNPDQNACAIYEFVAGTDRQWPAAPFDVSASTGLTAPVQTVSSGTTATRTVADSVSVAGVGIRSTTNTHSANNSYTNLEFAESTAPDVAGMIAAIKFETATGTSQVDFSWINAVNVMAGVVVYKTEAGIGQTNSYINIYPDVTFKAEGSGITGSAASSQAQTSA